ncbi:MAG: F0F1 ATP synthase subunit A [Alphaproteobacteria bacterium]|nr:F0F1 ATP synthase subunit A [Alphaproteobacteria bacterium]
MHQFEIAPILEPFIKTDTLEIGLTNSAAAMIAASLSITALMILSMSGRAVIPGRLQSIAELSYEFVANMIRDTAGTAGMRFMPFVFSLFMFILIGNLIGMFPYAFTFTSHIIVTFALAATVILSVLVIGFAKHGLGFLRLFAPSGLPVLLLPAIVVIEIISFLTRPVSLSVRLFANMLAGHTMLKVFAGFVSSLSALGTIGIIGAIVPLAGTLAITALEFLVAFLQAYIFAILTCIYLNDALHPAH